MPITLAAAPAAAAEAALEQQTWSCHGPGCTTAQYMQTSATFELLAKGFQRHMDRYLCQQSSYASALLCRSRKLAANSVILIASPVL